MRRVPRVNLSADWTVTERSGDRQRDRTAESLLTLGAGGLGTRGAVEETRVGVVPLVVAAGVYTGSGPAEHLLQGPDWTGLAFRCDIDDDTRTLDLRTGCLVRTGHAVDGPVHTIRFVSISEPGVMALRAEAAAGDIGPSALFRVPPDAQVTTGSLTTSREWARASSDRGGGIAAVGQQHVGKDGEIRTVERIAAYTWDARRRPRVSSATARLERARGLGFDRLFAEQRAEWARRWEHVNVVVPADPETQLGVRYALFQLWTNACRHSELALGARGVSGSGYAGHVFWDMDAFVIPAMCSIDPPSATAMVNYRLARLDAARAAAAALGHRGARFPWESASEGTDVTPREAQLQGRTVAIRTGLLEEHITADVAWAAHRVARWRGDIVDDPMSLVPLLTETARYWASRVRVTSDGQAHLFGVIGPDEYHDAVDDNAYTNVMARWNLRAAIAAAERTGGPTAETARWRQLADSLVDGLDAVTGRYEQFAGYDELEPLVMRDVAEPPVAADVLLGHDRVAGSQLIKQPDVLMLHHLVPDEVAPGSLAANLDFYAPRTAHGSSLSPTVMACLFARAGRTRDALAMLRMALRLDVGDTTGMVAGGLHLANLAGIWQTMLSGFAGVSVTRGVLHIDPRLPSEWPRLEIRFRALRRRIGLVICDDCVDITTDGPVEVSLSGGAVRMVEATARLCREESPKAKGH
ncbi:MAG TPA: glycosyl hydrolase family 65 protein [Jatrophihabitantaceae bacterium]|nr:glycosyl hydrolase family 65 protein [Jatrophihabitantaceae bacterium]